MVVCVDYRMTFVFCCCNYFLLVPEEGDEIDSRLGVAGGSLGVNISSEVMTSTVFTSKEERKRR